MINLGEISILLALISSLVSIKWKTARYVTTLFIVISSIFLFYILLSHNFQFSYVYEHTSSDLPLEYLISAFWAGQDGSLLFWVLILSLFMIREFESEIHRILNFIQLSLIFILYSSGMFSMLPKMPRDGLGLNPLLQDPWMAIHPPIVFIAYAALTIPFAYALSSLIKNNYNDWIKKARPWISFSWIFLTLGLAIGGLWAYEVLGWGGYWSWDPVESSSLIPWLISTALLHGAIIQRNKKGMKKTNIMLSILAFVSVIYATFVTRSGIIESVHAFTESSIGNYYLILIFLILIASLALFILRRKSFEPTKSETTRETLFFLTILTLCASSFAIFWGITFPIFWNTFTGLESNLGTDYYNQTNLPIAILLLLLMAACVIKFKFRKVYIIPAAALLILTIIDSLLAILILCIIALAIQAKKLTNGIRGGYVTHIGISLLIIGVIMSSVYTSVETVSLTQGQKKDVAGGFAISLDNVEHDQGRQGMLITEDITLYSGDNEIEKTRLSLTFTSEEGFKATTNSAHIVRNLDKDIYIIFQGVSSGQSVYNIKFIPLIMLVWLGVILTVLGSIITLLK